MENVLRRLFDYQKFEGSRALQQVIDSTHSRYAAVELDLDEMVFIAAAGTMEAMKQTESRKSGN